MRQLFRFPLRLLAAVAGTAIVGLTVGPVHAQYYPYAPYPSYPVPAYPMPAPVTYVPPQQTPPTAVVPVGLLTGDYRTWGWGNRSCDCPPPCCPAPQVAPVPAPPVPAPAPEVKPMPAPLAPPQPPAMVQPPVVLQPGEAEQGPALGSGSFALATPNMIGDFLGGCSVRTFPVTTTISGTANVFDVGPRPFSTPAQFNLLVAVPDLAFGDFKVAENESPIPRDRVFAYYEHYSGVLGVVEGSNLAAAGFAPLTLNGTVRFDVYSEVLGFEKTFFDGQASVEVRVPFFQTGGNIPAAVNGASPAPEPDGTTLAGSFNTTLDAESNVGDMTVVFKYAPYLNRDTGSAVAVGLAVTIPTGPTIPTAEGNDNCFLFQPYVGFLWNISQNWYVEGFSSFAIPSNSNADLVLFNDIGVGYWLFRSNSVLTGIIPTLEIHSNYEPNKNGNIGMNTDELDITAGIHTILNQRAILTLGASLPVTGPLPYTFEGIIELNYLF